MTIGVIAVGDLVAYSSQTLGTSGIAVVDQVTGPDVWVTLPGSPTRYHITRSDIVSVFTASSTAKS